MDIEQQTDLAAGKLSTEKLLAVIVAQQKRIAELELEAVIIQKNPTARVVEPYSENAEELRKRQAELDKKLKSKHKNQKGKGLQRGRVTTAEKAALAKRTASPSLLEESCLNLIVNKFNARAYEKVRSSRELYSFLSVFPKPESISGQTLV